MDPTAHNENEASDQEALYRFEKLRNLVNMGLHPLAILAGVLNLILIWYSIRLFRARKGCGVFAIIGSVCVADTIQTLFTSPVLIYFKALHVYKETFGHCQFVMNMTWLGKPASALSLALLSIDRLFYITREYQYPVIMSRRRTLVYVGLTWLICVLNLTLINTFHFIDIQIKSAHAPIHIQTVAYVHRNYTNFNLCNGFYSQYDITWYKMESIGVAVVPIILAFLVTFMLFRSQKSSASTVTSLVSAIWILATLLPLRLYNLISWSTGYEDIYVDFGLHVLEMIYTILNPMLCFALNEVYWSRVRGSSLFLSTLNVQLF